MSLKIAADSQKVSSIVSTLSVRLALLAAALLGVLSICVYLATASLHLRAQERLLTLKVNKLTETSELLLRDGDDRFLQLLQANAAKRPGTRLEIARNDGTAFYADPYDDAHRLSAQQRSRGFVLRGTDGTLALQGTFTIDIDQDTQLLDALGRILLLATLIGAVLAGSLAVLAVRHGLRPLYRLATQTEDMAREASPRHLVPTQQIRELTPLVDQFNHLMDHVSASHARLEAFNADVAHELRTPLTSLIGKTELALSRPRSTEDLTDTLVSNLASLRRMGALVNDMLFLARADGGEPARLGEPTSLRALILDMLEYHELAASERNLKLAVEGDLVVAVDEPLFLRALSNLISNATRYATTGSTISVTLETRHGVSYVGVSNQGPVITAENLPRLFDRLYQVDASRSYQAGMHCGLGLSIVAAIARMHGGKTWAQSDVRGTAIGLALPQSQPATPV
ncbi:heavy metal sensor histidine kinase [Pigmentiphaga aceris]|uniref:Sensor protein n=1 Tax=Pigmentiphaga aceris TaxID=1940612 RepID=A0A5C0AVT3_9BURK|nr:heavy metal sensor histidine kinase [Pigmentiphaga aceris]QEI05826.1 heavy metal sensor histidine kinase [Pigmentiphaga aceris]